MRRLSIFGLTCLLFASGWSPVLAAAFCPRGGGHDCCVAGPAEAEHAAAAAHHQGMEMNAEAPRPAHEGHEGASAAAFDHTSEDCTHCAAHSGGPKAPAVTFGVPGGLGTDAAFAAPQVYSFFSSTPPANELLVSSRPHGPPPGTAPRHLLINVFLI